MPLRSYQAHLAGQARHDRAPRSKRSRRKEPYKPLLESQTRGSGRNNAGRLTVRHRGGGEKQHYRDHRLQARQAGRAGAARHDRVRPEPLRADRPAPLSRRREALHAPAARPQGGRRRASPAPRPRRASATRCPIANIPLGTTIHNIELVPGKGGQIVRSAGTAAQLLAKEGEYAQVRLPSGEVRRVSIKLHGHHRPGQQPRPREPEPRQGGSVTPHGPAARSARRRHEPA